MRVEASGTDANAGGPVGSAAAAAPGPQGLWARLAAAAVADELEEVEPEPPHVDFLRRMAEIDAAYDRGLDADPGADVIDFETRARSRR